MGGKAFKLRAIDKGPSIGLCAADQGPIIGPRGLAELQHHELEAVIAKLEREEALGKNDTDSKRDQLSWGAIANELNVREPNGNSANAEMEEHPNRKMVELCTNAGSRFGNSKWLPKGCETIRYIENQDLTVNSKCTKGY